MNKSLSRIPKVLLYVFIRIYLYTFDTLYTRSSHSIHPSIRYKEPRPGHYIQAGRDLYLPLPTIYYLATAKSRRRRLSTLAIRPYLILLLIFDLPDEFMAKST